MRYTFTANKKSYEYKSIKAARKSAINCLSKGMMNEIPISRDGAYVGTVKRHSYDNFEWESKKNPIWSESSGRMLIWKTTHELKKNGELGKKLR